MSEPVPDVTPGLSDRYMGAEIDRGKQFYLDGLIEQAYMDPRVRADARRHVEAGAGAQRKARLASSGDHS